MAKWRRGSAKTHIAHWLLDDTGGEPAGQIPPGPCAPLPHRTVRQHGLTCWIYRLSRVELSAAAAPAVAAGARPTSVPIKTVAPVGRSAGRQ